MGLLFGRIENKIENKRINWREKEKKKIIYDVSWTKLDHPLHKIIEIKLMFSSNPIKII